MGGVRIFEADIIYHLEENFRKHMKEVHERQREAHKHIAIFPCRLRILPTDIYSRRDPIIMGVHVEEGIVREGTPLCIPAKDKLRIGIVASVQFNNEDIELGKKGQDVCIKVVPD